MRREHLVQRVHHFGDAQIFNVANGADEVAPEVAQDLFPFQLVVGNEVELFFQARREVVLDIAHEEIFKERDDDAAFVFGNEPLLFNFHVVAFDQHGHRRGVG